MNIIKKKSKIIISSIIIVIIISIVGGLGYIKSQQYQPSSTANQAATQAEDTKNYLAFNSSVTDKPAIIFYQGALVDTESYSIWALELANAGYPVYLLKAPLDMAILSPNKADEVIDLIGDQEYIIGGHSLGGVIASRYASNHADDNQLLGIFFLASYPDKNGNLSSLDINVISITASNDQVLNAAAYQEAESYLPDNTLYETIEGGNHAGFGSYGEQKGDGQASISNTEQQAILSALLINWIETE